MSTTAEGANGSAAAGGSEHTGETPPGPHRFSAGEWIAVGKRTFKEFLSDECMDLAKQIAYSSLLAFFPAVLFLVGLLGLIDAFDDVESFLAPVAPGAVLDTLDEVQKTAGGDQEGEAALTFVIGGVGAIWAASGAMSAVVKAVNRAYDRQETRPFWKLRLTSIALVLLTGAAAIGLLVLIIFGGPLGEAIADRANLGGAFELIWNILRWPLAFLGVLFFFAAVFYLAPYLRPRNWRWVSPGSLVGGALWLALSGLFALYTSFFGSYDKTYGTLASGIILLLWLNYSAFALLFGAELNAELDRQAEIRSAGGPHAGLMKPSRRAS